MEDILKQAFQRDLGYTKIDETLHMTMKRLRWIQDRELQEALVGGLEAIRKLIPEVEINK